MSVRRPTRAAGSVRRRTPEVKRRSAGLSPVRAAAALAIVAASLGVYGAATSAVFSFARLEVVGDRWTDTELVRRTLAIPDGANLFRLSTDALVERLEGLPTVRRVEVSVALPDMVIVRLAERTAIMTWRIGDHRYLVDETGTLFADEPGDTPLTGPDEESLPAIDDRRFLSVTYLLGDRMPATDIDVATRLGSLTPADIGSAATALVVSIHDDEGFVVRAVSPGWRAVFGFYTPELRKPAIIPGQVRLLRSLLLGREDSVGRVILATETDGTFTTRETPRPSPSPSPAVP